MGRKLVPIAASGLVRLVRRGRQGPGTAGTERIRAWYVSGTERKLPIGPGTAASCCVGLTVPMIALKIHCPEEGLASNGSGYGPSHHRLNGLVTCDN
jgi:hypothetical protein